MAKSTRATLAAAAAGVPHEIHEYAYDADAPAIGMHAADEERGQGKATEGSPKAAGRGIQGAGSHAPSIDIIRDRNM